MELEIAERVIAEAHARLDSATVPSCHGACCTDPTCNTRLGHRIKLLVAERDALRQDLQELLAALHADEQESSTQTRIRAAMAIELATQRMERRNDP